MTCLSSLPPPWCFLYSQGCLKASVAVKCFNFFLSPSSPFAVIVISIKKTDTAFMTLKSIIKTKITFQGWKQIVCSCAVLTGCCGENRCLLAVVWRDERVISCPAGTGEPAWGRSPTKAAVTPGPGRERSCL